MSIYYGSKKNVTIKYVPTFYFLPILNWNLKNLFKKNIHGKNVQNENYIQDIENHYVKIIFYFWT